ncbi:MAG: hypothetical protein IJ529_02740 [Alphaproteobacteria bacterium]|nr:hypothetical protein [Alphaproteobacteria bacterium]
MSNKLLDFQEWLDKTGNFEYVEQYDKEKKEKKEENVNISSQTYEEFCKWLTDKGLSNLIYKYEHKK